MRGLIQAWQAGEGQLLLAGGYPNKLGEEGQQSEVPAPSQAESPAQNQLEQHNGGLMNNYSN
jgi:hypothetical protein